jgi:hypothetical protein
MGNHETASWWLVKGVLAGPVRLLTLPCSSPTLNQSISTIPATTSATDFSVMVGSLVTLRSPRSYLFFYERSPCGRDTSTRDCTLDEDLERCTRLGLRFLSVIPSTSPAPRVAVAAQKQQYQRSPIAQSKSPERAGKHTASQEESVPTKSFELCCDCLRPAARPPSCPTLLC